MDGAGLQHLAIDGKFQVLGLVSLAELLAKTWQRLVETGVVLAEGSQRNWRSVWVHHLELVHWQVHCPDPTSKVDGGLGD